MATTSRALAPLAFGCTLLSICIAIAHPAHAHAQADAEGTTDAERPEPTQAELDEARHSFELARRAFDAGDYETAADEFRAAHELMRHPDLLFNLYLAEERRGRHVEAADALTGYLAGATIAPEQRALLERRLARLRARIERARTGAAETEPAAAEDDLALRDPIALGAPDDDRRDPDPDPDPDARATPAPSAAPESGGPPVAAVATLIAAGVLAASFAVFAALSEVEDQALAAECGRDVGGLCSADRLSTLEAFNIAADVSWIAAVVAGATGVVLLFVLPPDGASSTSSTEVALAPWATPTAFGAAAGGRF